MGGRLPSERALHSPSLTKKFSIPSTSANFQTKSHIDKDDEIIAEYECLDTCAIGKMFNELKKLHKVSIDERFDVGQSGRRS